MKRTQGKWILSILLCLLLALGSLGVTAFAEEASALPAAPAEDAALSEAEAAPLSEGQLDVMKPVTTYAGLKEALAYGGTVLLGADITAPTEGKMLLVPTGIQVTLNLNGHKLELRTFVSEDDIKACIRNQGTLNLIDPNGTDLYPAHRAN